MDRRYGCRLQRNGSAFLLLRCSWGQRACCDSFRRTAVFQSASAVAAMANASAMPDLRFQTATPFAPDHPTAESGPAATDRLSPRPATLRLISNLRSQISDCRAHRTIAPPAPSDAEHGDGSRHDRGQGLGHDVQAYRRPAHDVAV